MLETYIRAKLAQLTIKDWALLIAAIGYVLVYALWPSPQTTTRIETVVEFKDREVIKIVEKDVVKFRDRVVNRTVVKPDGTKVTTSIEDRSGENNTTKEVSVVKETELKEVTRVVSTDTAAKYSLGVLAYPVSLRDLQQGFDYRISGTYWFANHTGVSISSDIRDIRPFLGVEVRW